MVIKWKNRAHALLIMLVTLTLTCSTVYAAKVEAMSDVSPEKWYYEAVDYVLENGLMSGYSPSSFGPDNTLSRAMVVQVLYNKEGQPLSPFIASGDNIFPDVSFDQWYNNAVTWAATNGIVSGYSDGRFGPNDAVTLEQAAVILWNYSNCPSGSGSLDVLGTYSDWAANALMWVSENALFDGLVFDNATETATRAHIAHIFMNYIQLWESNTLRDFPAIVLPDWGELEVVNDPYGGEYSFAIYSGKDEQMDENIPQEIVDIIQEWFVSLEKSGWIKTEPNDAYHYMDYDFLTNEKLDILYGFKFYLGVSTYGGNLSYYSFNIIPVYYQIIYKDSGEYMKVLSDDVYDYIDYEGEWKVSSPDKITIYDSNNNTKELYDYEAAPYLTAGWSTEPHMVTMYSPDGEAITIGIQEVATYKANGWYTEPVTIMYAPDGRTIIVPQAEVWEYRNNGWYETEYEASEANKPNEDPTAPYNPAPDGHYYRTPTGKKYHLDPNCGGKNSYRTTNIAGLSPCSKCAR